MGGRKRGFLVRASVVAMRMCVGSPWLGFGALNGLLGAHLGLGGNPHSPARSRPGLGPDVIGRKILHAVLDPLREADQNLGEVIVRSLQGPFTCEFCKGRNCDWPPPVAPFSPLSISPETASRIERILAQGDLDEMIRVPRAQLQ